MIKDKRFLKKGIFIVYTCDMWGKNLASKVDNSTTHNTCFLNGVVHKRGWNNSQTWKESKLINGLKNKNGFLTPLSPFSLIVTLIEELKECCLLWNVYTLINYNYMNHLHPLCRIQNNYCYRLYQNDYVSLPN